MLGRLLNGDGVRSAVISVLAGICVVIAAWWQIEAQIQTQIDQTVAPIQKQLNQSVRKIDRTTALANQNNGMLRAIAARLLIDVPPPLPPPGPAPPSE